MAASNPKIILITGCSDGGIGAALALELHRRGHRVIATARDVGKMAKLREAKITTLTLDVTSSSSIDACVAEVSALTDDRLDMLINNAGGGYTMPLSDVELTPARAMFEQNFWSVLTVTQAFLHMLIRSKGIAVNNGSLSAINPVPHYGMYCASKAAAAMLSDVMRMEFAPFGVQVVDMKTGGVKSNFIKNNKSHSVLPEASIYTPIAPELEKIFAADEAAVRGMPTGYFASEVVDALLRPKMPREIWKGAFVGQIWLMRRFLPASVVDGFMARVGALDVLEKRLKSMEEQ